MCGLHVCMQYMCDLCVLNLCPHCSRARVVRAPCRGPAQDVLGQSGTRDAVQASTPHPREPPGSMRQVKKLVRGLKSRRPPLARSLQLWQCVCRTLKGASAILRNASCGAKQNSGKASHGSLSKRQSGRLLACVVCSIHGVHHTLLFFIFHNFTLHSTESSSNPHRAVLLLTSGSQPASPSRSNELTV